MKYEILMMLLVGTGCKRNRANTSHCCKCIKQQYHCLGGQYVKYVSLDKFCSLLAKRRNVRVSHSV